MAEQKFDPTMGDLRAIQYSRDQVLHMVRDKIKGIAGAIRDNQAELAVYETKVDALKTTIATLEAELVGLKRWLLSQGVEDINPELDD